ncbi:MAG: extracellular solute-binding protein [Dongiaceae bacterium]
MNFLLSRRHVLVSGLAVPLLPQTFRRTLAAAGTIKTNAMAEFGEPLYTADLAHWPYVDPSAPKGGSVVLGDFGSFDSLNPYILQGDWPTSIGLIDDGLTMGSGDELSTAYPLIAESFEYPEDKSWIIFNLRPEARYHDGVGVVAADVKFAFDTIKDHGRPFLKSFYEDIESCEALSDYVVKFTMKTRDNMKPLMIAAGMSPLARHFWESRDITKPSLDPPLGCGAYRITRVDAGRSLTYERLDDYWGADLPVNRGTGNFDIIRYDYYRDDTVMFEAFKAGRIDYRGEISAQRWVTQYDFPQVKNGKVVARAVPNETPRGMGAYFFNIRRPQLTDLRVRRAIIYLYDFETIQRTLLYGKYKRIKSYFPNSDFGVSGPPRPEEIAILEPFRDKVPAEVFTEAYEPPVTDGAGNNRANLRTALRLFKEAGWDLKGGKLVKSDTGEPFKLEIMTADPETERQSSPFIQSLQRAGLDASLRIVTPVEWEKRIDDLDFDVWTGSFNFFPPPGPELRSYFGSQAADIRGSANSIGIKDPVVDALIEQIIAAKDLETLKATTRALDRVLLWNEYCVPRYYNHETWIAYWNKFAYPARKPKYSVGFPATWWIADGAASQTSTQ